MSRVAVVGAGIAGVACARALADAGHQVRIYEKSRGTGGRMATRRGDAGTFDHGAQYFTARDPRFQSLIRHLETKGVLAPYRGRIAQWSAGVLKPVADREPRYVGLPGMPALCRALAEGVEIVHEQQVAAVEQLQGRWSVLGAAGRDDGYDALVLAVPAVQALPLSVAVPGIAARVAQGRHHPCWALLVKFAAPLPVDFDAAFIEGAHLGWMMRDSSKPGREPGERWVLHATADWSRENLELDAGAVVPLLIEALRVVVPAMPPVIEARAHRWRYALSPGLGVGSLFDRDARFAACGDWCADGRVEGAWQSGVDLAAKLLPAL